MTNFSFIQSAKNVLSIEADAISQLIESLDQQFTQACELILNCEGRVIVTGMGKSGHIASKIAATFASTGTPAFFVHPGEASHGDLGMITPKDLVVAISNSGEAPEILTILPIIKRMGVRLIGMAGDAKSTLAKLSDAYLEVKVSQEACPMNLAPTASTTACLAMGDALAIAILEARDFNEQDFARSHPGGSLGRRLLLYVQDIMHTDQNIPLVKSNRPLSDALFEMSSKGLGMTGIVDDKNQLLGIYTDGDLRRSLANGTSLETPIDELMSSNPVTVSPDILAAEVVATMKNNRINSLFVTEKNKQVVGALNMHDLLKAGVL